MRASALTPTYAPLPFGNHPAAGSDSGTSLTMSPEAVARFDALLHEIHPDALRVDAPRLQALAGWLASLSLEDARAVLDLRLKRIEQLRAMLDDPQWDPDDAMRARLAKLLGYIDLDEDVIPDSTPLLGLLDDVLLFELAWPAFEAEAEEYRDFCHYRIDEHPGGDGAHQRAAWLRDRLAELALLQHNARVNESHYANGRLPDTVFRISG